MGSRSTRLVCRRNLNSKNGPSGTIVALFAHKLNFTKTPNPKGWVYSFRAKSTFKAIQGLDEKKNLLQARCSKYLFFYQFFDFLEGQAGTLTYKFGSHSRGEKGFSNFLALFFSPFFHALFPALFYALYDHLVYGFI